MSAGAKRMLERKERTAKLTGIAGDVTIWIGVVIALVLLAFGAPGTLAVAAAVLCVTGMITSSLGATFADTYRWQREALDCTECDGTGTSWDESTGGKCWDCRGTGLFNGGEA